MCVIHAYSVTAPPCRQPCFFRTGRLPREQSVLHPCRGPVHPGTGFRGCRRYGLSQSCPSISKLDVGEECTGEELRSHIRRHLKKHSLTRVRRREVGDAARLVHHLAPHGLIRLDEKAIDELPPDGVPDCIVDMVGLQQARMVFLRAENR